jgi:hypothetical protein
MADNTKSEEDQEIRLNQEETTSAHVGLLNHTTYHKYSYNRWKTIVNVIIQKESGNMRSV